MRFFYTFFVAAILLATTPCFAQITFEPGYFIDTEGQKVECLIRNVEWRYNPQSIEYQLDESDSIRTISAHEIDEFMVGGYLKYISRTVQIDRSPVTVRDYDKISISQAPEFTTERLMLKVLIEGQASLYAYYEPNLNKYFYQTEDREVEQLIYKIYLKPNPKYAHRETDYSKNRFYRQQLLAYVSCQPGDTPLNRIAQTLEYKLSELKMYFKKYNECIGAEFKELKKPNEFQMNLSLRPGMRMGTIYAEDNRRPSTRGNSFNLPVGIGYQMGVGFEFVLPFNKGRWSMVLEPTYQYFAQEGDYQLDLFSRTIDQHVKVNYQAIEVPLAFRYKTYLNTGILYFNPFVSYAVPINASYFSNQESDNFGEGREIQYTIGNTVVFGLGVGYQYNDHFGLELRYNGKRDLMIDHTSWYTKYRTLSLILSYTLDSVND